MAAAAQSALLRLPRPHSGPATLPDCSRLRVRPFHAADQALPLLRGGGEPRLHHRRVAPLGHGEADGHLSQRWQRHSGSQCYKTFYRCNLLI